MAQLENIEVIEKRLWGSADKLRANSNYASNEYFMPVMGLIFLRHAYSRYLAFKPQIEATLPSRGGVTRPLTKEDFSSKGAIYLQGKAQFEYLVNLNDADDRAQAIINAMEAIEADYETLKGILPKSEYQELDNAVLGNLLRTFNDPALKKATGDIFGRIYEYFLTQFANQSAHDGGEFFTPVSLVQMIVNFIEPDHGSVIDPACGSGGMFVQSAHNMMGAIPKQEIIHFSMLYMKLKSFDFGSLSGGAAVPFLSATALAKEPILIPEKRLSGQFSEISEPIFKKIVNLQTQITELTRARDLLLPKLMSGEIVV